MPDLKSLIPANQKLILSVKVLPKSSINKITEVNSLPNQQFQLKIKLTAAPVDGEANQALIKFLSRELEISQSAICIVKGFNSRNKQIEIQT